MIEEVPEGVDGVVSVSIQVPFPETYIYTNCSSYSLSPFDFKISFAELLPSGKAEARVGITLPPEHAVMVVMNLIAQIRTFESHFGELRNPEWKAMRAKWAALPLTPNESTAKPRPKPKVDRE